MTRIQNGGRGYGKWKSQLFPLTAFLRPLSNNNVVMVELQRAAALAMEMFLLYTWDLCSIFQCGHR